MLSITGNEVKIFIKKFKGRFSAGYDGIPEYVVKQCAKFTYLQHFNKLWYVSRKILIEIQI
jgi:hypothetical protein